MVERLVGRREAEDGQMFDGINAPLPEREASGQCTLYDTIGDRHDIVHDLKLFAICKYLCDVRSGREG